MSQAPGDENKPEEKAEPQPAAPSVPATQPPSAATPAPTKEKEAELPKWMVGLLLGLSIVVTASIILSAFGVHLGLWQIPP